MSDNKLGLGLALSSSVLIGSSFIIKKKGLIRARGSGNGAADGGFAYLKESLWWLGLITMVLGEVFNFVAYGFAPAILVTPLGALSVIISAVLASIMLDEQLALLGKLGCLLSIVGSTIIVMNAPEEQEVKSIDEIIMRMETNLGFHLYAFFVVCVTSVLIFHYSPLYGRTNVFVYVTICSLVGSISVIGVKGLAIGIKLTLEGNNQMQKKGFWFFVVLVASSIATQMNYLNKALDTFNTAVVSPIYYVVFTTATIVASAILFNGWDDADTDNVGTGSASDNVDSSTASKCNFGTSDLITVVCGFLTIVVGVSLLHISRQDEEAKTTAAAASRGHSDVATAAAELLRTADSAV